MLCVGNLLPLNTYFASFLKQIRLFIFVHQKSLKLTFETGLLVHITYLNLCGQAENSKWILCSQKQVLNERIKDFWCKKYNFVMIKSM